MNKIHCKKGSAIFPSPAWMSLTKLSLAGNNLIIPLINQHMGNIAKKWPPHYQKRNKEEEEDIYNIGVKAFLEFRIFGR